MNFEPWLQNAIYLDSKSGQSGRALDVATPNPQGDLFLSTIPKGRTL